MSDDETQMVEFPLSEFHRHRALYAANRDVLWPIGLALTVERDGDNYLRLYVSQYLTGRHVELIVDPQPDYDAEFEAFCAERRDLMSAEDRKLADEGLAGKTLDAEHEPWCYRRHAGDCVDGDAMSEPLTAGEALRRSTFTEYRKTALTPISDITYPPGTVFQTPEGLRAEDEDTRAAFDVQGNIYPIRESVFRASYVATTTPDTRLREAAQLLLDDLLCLRQSGGSRSRRPRASEMNLRALMDGLRLVSEVQAEVDALRKALADLDANVEELP